MTQLSILDVIQARTERDAGINRATDHAEAINPGWNEMAYNLLKRFLSVHHGPFMAEELRSYAAQIDFPLPPHARAWGGIMARAAKSGIIERVGLGPVSNVKAHCANATIWRKTL